MKKGGTPYASASNNDRKPTDPRRRPQARKKTAPEKAQRPEQRKTPQLLKALQPPKTAQLLKTSQPVKAPPSPKTPPPKAPQLLKTSQPSKKVSPLRITLIIAAVVVVLGCLVATALYHRDPARFLYHDGGLGFHLISVDDTHTAATIISADTTAPVKAQVRAIYQTGNLWVDLLARVKDEQKSYPVKQVSGLNSSKAPIDLSELATDTAVVLPGQVIRYTTPCYSIEATQSGSDTLTVLTASAESTATLPTQLFTDTRGHPLSVKLSELFEAKLIAEVVRAAGTQVEKSSEYKAIIQNIKQTVQPYSQVMSASAAQTIQTKLDYINSEEVKLAVYEGILLNVPLRSQLPAFPAGCEAASTAMLICYGGHPVTVAEIVSAMPYSSDPSSGYVGNPRNWSGWTIYPSAMKSVVRQYLGTGTNLTGIGMYDLYAQLRAGKPVVCWLGGSVLPGIHLHCVCVTGYGQGMVYYNDPYLNIKNKAVSAKTFASWWAVYGDRAMSY